jgi:hypothetical protein
VRRIGVMVVNAGSDPEGKRASENRRLVY